MSATASHAEGKDADLGRSERNGAQRMGLKAGDIVVQLGEDDGIDTGVVEDVLRICGGELIDPESDEVVDVVLLWFRDGDGDLVDALVDARPQLGDGGAIWLITPKAGRDGHVEPSDVLEAVPTAGLAQTSTVSVALDWTAMKLTAPKGIRAPRR